MTTDYIAFHAAERPDAAAFIDNGRTITYAELNHELRQFMRALTELGLRRGHCVGVACGSLYVHWVLVLALHRLGVATMSLLMPNLAPRMVSRLDALFSDRSPPPGQAGRC